MSQVLPLTMPDAVPLERTSAAEERAIAPALSKQDGPVPMSFPGILRHPGLSNRYAHLHIATEHANSSSASVVPKKNRRDEKEGKRWVRRKENARFIGNAHIVLPSKKDFSVPTPSPPSVFPQPLPNYLSRNNVIPPGIPATRDPISANAGRFSMSLKGMRRELRKSGPRTQLLVKEIEHELLSWLYAGGVLLSPDTATELSFPGVQVGSTGAIREVSRNPLQLVWWIEDVAFTRYIVHCCARYHEVVSFSKDASNQRLTYLLRPNVTRPKHLPGNHLETPPSTDLDTDFVSDSDLVSERDSLTDADSDADGPALFTAHSPALSAISEGSGVPAPGSPIILPAVPTYVSDDQWSVIGETEGDADDSEAESHLADSVHSLSLDPDRTPRAQPRIRQVSLRSQVWERSRRSASSPSRSPARRAAPRLQPQPLERPVQPGGQSFYDYLFS